MSRYNKPVNFKTKDILLQAVVLAGTIALLACFIPRDHSFLQYELNHPWPYSQIIPDFEFPILKSDEQLAHERDSIHELYEPYLQLLPLVESAQLNRFRSDFRQLNPQEYPVAYRSFIEGRLRQAYERGIISNSDREVLIGDSVHNVQVYYGIEAQSRSLARLLTQKEAYESLLADTDTLGYSSQKLKKLNLNQYLEPNLSYDKAKSEAEWKGLEEGLLTSSGMVMAGQSIVDRGQMVDEKTYLILKSYEHALDQQRRQGTDDDLQLAGQVLYIAVICLGLLLYFDLFRRDYVSSLRSVTLLLTQLLLFPLLTNILVSHGMIMVYLIPYAMLPIFVRVFMDSRTAFITHMATILLCSMTLKYPYEFLVTQFVAGLAAIYSLRELSTRSQIIRTAILVTVASLLVYLSIDLLHGRTLMKGDGIMPIEWNYYKHIMISGTLLLFSYPLMYFLEKIFGFTSNVTLVELSNINSDLLRKLSEVAPGTFQHSMQVANLAAEVALKIGAKSQLVRTGALYHDIGKIQNPAFFTENQAGSINPHDQIDNRQSAQIIIRHVSDGEQLAERHRLPRVIRDFISTHHGRGLARYFYVSYQNAHPEEEVDPEPFRYPGPNPSTAEQAILMMADAVEASARSLKDYNEETIGALVDRIIDAQMAQGFFVDCPITFKDIKLAKEVFKEKLKIVYHTRISYPELKKKDEGAEGSVVTPQLPTA
ncbi:MAG: HDIG domain-containing protein [Bacteroidaceae bacterium]|nr:HDIG domain-containing protein [Bacteroidaceae bacterium]